MTDAILKQLDEWKKLSDGATEALNSPSSSDFRKEMKRVEAVGKLERAARTGWPATMDALRVAVEALEYYAPVENWLSKHGAYTDENAESGTLARRALTRINSLLAGEGGG